jgi:general secretion pathway protein K
MLTDLQDETTSELSATLADRDALKAEYLAKSGVNLARLLIATEPTIRQGLSFLFALSQRQPPQVPVWEFSDRILGAFNDQEGSEQFALLTGTDFSKGKNLGIEGGKFELTIVDEDAKLNVNVAARGEPNAQLRLARQLLALMAGDRYNPMFEQRDRDDNFTDRSTVCGAIVDWADADDDLFGCDPTNTSAPPTKGTEDISYQLLKKPYFRKNAAYDSLDELHLVRGVSDDFWATFIDPEPDKPKKRVVTVWGQGTINVNSANAQTLLATVCAYAVPTTKLCNDPLEAEKFLLGVTLVRGFTAGIPLFSSGNDFIAAMQGKGMVGKLLTALAIEPVAFTSPGEAVKQVTAESKMFSIYADGIVPGYRRKTQVRIHAVVDFRSAPPPDGGLVAQGGGGAAGGSGAANLASRPVTAGTGGAGGASGSTAQDALTSVMAPNPGGTIVYYRME